MTDIKTLEQRWAELAGKPKTKAEIEETLLLSKQIGIERAKEHEALTNELAEVGIHIENIYDLVNTKTKYPEAIPILVKHLEGCYSDKVKEGIVRALSVPEAKGLLVPLLIKEYLQLSSGNETLKWAIGNAVNVTIAKNEVTDIFPIVLNEENGLSRQMFVAALGKINTENVKEVLLRLLNDHNKIIRDEAKKALKLR